jgi:hypothetical protein
MLGRVRNFAATSHWLNTSGMGQKASSRWVPLGIGSAQKGETHLDCRKDPKLCSHAAENIVVSATRSQQDSARTPATGEGVFVFMNPVWPNLNLSNGSGLKDTCATKPRRRSLSHD